MVVFHKVLQILPKVQIHKVVSLVVYPTFPRVQVYPTFPKVQVYPTFPKV